MHEDEYFRLRDEQLERRARPGARPLPQGARAARRRRRARPRRRPGAAHRHGPRAGPGGPDRQAAPARVVHPAGHERGDALGGHARRGLRHARGEVLRPQPHVHAADRRPHLAPAGLRLGPAPPRGPGVLARRPARAALARDPRVHRVRGQRPQPVRQPAGHARRGQRVEARARSASRAGAACRCARCSSAPASPAAPSTCSPRASTRPSSPAAPTRATCAGRCPSRRRWTTPCSPTR